MKTFTEKDCVIDIITNGSRVSQVRITHTPSKASVTAAGEEHIIKSRATRVDLLSDLKIKVEAVS